MKQGKGDGHTDILRKLFGKQIVSAARVWRQKEDEAMKPEEVLSLTPGAVVVINEKCLDVPTGIKGIVESVPTDKNGDGLYAFFPEVFDDSDIRYIRAYEIDPQPKRDEQQAMELIPDDLAQKIPPMDEVDEEFMDTPLAAYVYLYQPDGPFEWYITNYDGNDTAWVLALNPFTGDWEHGPISLNEIREIRGALGLRVEREEFVNPVKLTTLIQRLKG